MKKTILLFGIFALLGTVAAWYIMMGDQKSTRSESETNFGIKDIGQVQKIFIADRSGETTTLERQGKYWLYNGKYRARPDAMRNLLDAMRRVDVNYVVARAAVDNIVKDLATDGIKVEAYNKDNNKIRSYYVGGMTNDELGTYMIMEGANEPYVTHIPSWEGGLRARYQLKGEEWRDRHVFQEDVEQIESVSMEYPTQKSKSFKLMRTEEGFDVSPFYEVTPRSQRPFKAGTPEAFLMGFESLIAEAFQNRNPERDSILRRIPFCNATVNYKDGQSRTASFYPVVQYDASGKVITDYQVMAANTAIERYHTLVNNDDFMLVQQRIFGKIFWPYDAFFQ
ncbi:MAG: DUF4340 domain-containing protein [Bacteroidota bacterium]